MTLFDAHWSDEVTEDGQLLVRFLEYHGTVIDIWLGDMEDSSSEDHEIAHAIAQLPNLLRSIRKVFTAYNKLTPGQPQAFVRAMQNMYVIYDGMTGAENLEEAA